MFDKWKTQLDFTLPKQYEAFLDSLKENEVIDIFDDFGNGAYFYGYTALLERNQTYEVAEYVPDYFMIGQNGDLGFSFINKVVMRFTLWIWARWVLWKWIMSPRISQI